MISWDAEFDFVTIGGGIGGLASAIVAHEAGLTVLVLEKSDQVGGVAALSLGQVWVAGNDCEAELGIADSPRRGQDYMMWVGGGFSMPDHARTYCERAPGVVRFFRDRAGIRWRLWRGQPDYYYPEAPGSMAEGRCLEVEPYPGRCLGQWAASTRDSNRMRLTNEEKRGSVPAGVAERREADDIRTLGGGLAGYLVGGALSRGIQMWTEAATTELVREHGRAVGLRVRVGGKQVKVRARCGILLATSGYDWNADLASSFDARPGGASLTMPEVTGDHLRLAGMLGAKPVFSAARPQWVDHRFRVGTTLPRLKTELPHAIMVNRHGRRFCDESFGPSYTAALSNVDVDQPCLANQPFWGVFDDHYRRHYGVGPWGPADELPAEVVSASTPEGLAEKAGFDPEGFADELAVFNPAASEGRDDRFRRGSRPVAVGKGDGTAPHPLLGPIDTAPYYAVELRSVSIGIPNVGLAADLNGRVLDWSNKPIPGLYVTGNSMALHEMGTGYQSGYANMRAMIFGSLAACDAAGVDPETLGL